MKIIDYTELTPEIARTGVFVKGMPNADYHAYAGISKSGLDAVHKSPAHYAFAPPRKATRAMEIGTAIHAAILEPELFKRDYVLLKDVADRRASAYKEAIKVHTSERVLIASEADRVSGMFEACASDADVQDAMKGGGYTELSAFVECPETGALLKCRYDWINTAGSAVDVKKTRDSSPDGFAKSIWNYRYHVQDAFYRHVYRLITGDELRFEFLAVEEESPYNPMMYELDELSRMVAEPEMREDLAKYADCEKSGDWHGYGGGRQQISLPDWVFAKLDNDIVEEIV